jgi:hypothetical protein
LFRCYGNGSRAFLLSIYLAVTSHQIFRGRVYAVTSPFPSHTPRVPAKPKTLSRQNKLCLIVTPITLSQCTAVQPVSSQFQQLCLFNIYTHYKGQRWNRGKFQKFLPVNVDLLALATRLLHARWLTAAHSHFIVSHLPLQQLHAHSLFIASHLSPVHHFTSGD